MSCHPGVRQPGQELLPDADSCQACHGQRTVQLVSATSREPDEREVRKHLVFDHASHLRLPQIGGQCHRCHAAISDDGASGSSFPSMDDCLGCHDGDIRRAVCVSCHQRSNLRQLVPRSFLRHDAAFVRRHGAAATSDAALCNQCHGGTFCVDCHDSSTNLRAEARTPEAIDRELIHRGDFITRHAIESRASPTRCLRCHEVSSCEGCHLERGVSAGRIGALNPHPIGWVGPNVGGDDFHGRRARRDLLGCAGCHDRGPATNCIRCHKVGGHGGNPHPAGWRSSRSKDTAMCGYCHAM